jgi:hypothetical protein
MGGYRTNITVENVLLYKKVTFYVYTERKPLLAYLILGISSKSGLGGRRDEKNHRIC